GVLFEQPCFAVADAGADDPIGRACDDDTGGFTDADSIVGLPQHVAPGCWIVVQRGSSRHLANNGVSGVPTRTRAASTVGNDDHHTVVEVDHFDAILASLLVRNRDGCRFEAVHGGARKNFTSPTLAASAESRQDRAP